MKKKKKKLHLLGWDYSEKTLLERNLQERKIRRENGFCKRQRKVLIFIHIEGDIRYAQYHINIFSEWK